MGRVWEGMKGAFWRDLKKTSSKSGGQPGQNFSSKWRSSIPNLCWWGGMMLYDTVGSLYKSCIRGPKLQNPCTSLTGHCARFMLSGGHQAGGFLWFPCVLLWTFVGIAWHCMALSVSVMNLSISFCFCLKVFKEEMAERSVVAAQKKED